MQLDEQISKYRSLNEWFCTPQGQHVAQAFAAELEYVSGEFSGLNLLQLGACGDNVWLSSLRYRNQWIASPCVIPKKASLVTSLNLLPIERDRIDCVISPLTLEAFSGTKNPIDEIDRILKPMGYAIFFGINPISFWGAALRWGNLTCFGSFASTLTSSLTLRHTMLTRGYRQCALTSFYYIPPVSSEFMIQKLGFFNEMGKMLWPFPAAFYCLIVQKYQQCPPSLLFEATARELSALPASGISTVFSRLK